MTVNKQIRVEVDVIRKRVYEFTVDAVLDEYGGIDHNLTSIKAAEEYEKAYESGALEMYYSDEDFEYEIGDIVDDED